MVTKYEIAPFLQAHEPIIDVRSPKEFKHGHLPGAHNIPLFTDTEHAEIGTSYKHEGHTIAFQKGLSIVSEKLDTIILHAQKVCIKRRARIYCWRGGMRSSSVAELFQLLGIDSSTLIGGYKTFRGWVSATLQQHRKIKILGGLSGAGKTRILHALKDAGEQVIDLESIAKHRGSAYGNQGEQPSTEHFENEIAMLYTAFDPQRPVWLEDESHLIGRCNLPKEFFAAMQRASLYFIDVPTDKRIATIEKDYSSLKKEDAIESTMRLQKKLGGLKTKQAIEFIKQGDYASAAKIALQYYDKSYRYHTKKRCGDVIYIKAANASYNEIAQQLRNP